ncbi:putative uncharacterized protein DDB_G0282129 [Bactrocera tryoni]|uniref:putative uncharacterized protein DDB_G0282129 n=1 Tax=Bactrocera tryoni TaxID=59916 RepID=UPI001A98AC6B|nr:putative uncharacterized protein DDB_G0282129 [Bactrocera tryoni]
MLTDCSSIQGSTASSSSDVMTLATTSSWCAMSIPSSAAAAAVTSTRLRILRLVRPHARRILVTPDTSPSFGFTVRGGKEFGTGFFISSVERNSEAELKGMRIGDQILRINGFRVDDAVHKEIIQFITNQDRITMKVRSVGMLPIKDKDADKLSWHAVKTFTNGSSASSESSYKVAPERETRNKEVNITLDVAPRTKLGLGICKGPEWKPGIFVQFTKEKSVAREAGLRQGDQILSVNSIDFSDVLFSEAVAVMKSASKLEMAVRKAAGCDLFPGESSGYNSSASSVTGDQSPCWADAKSKRLTAVREETTTAPIWNEPPGAAAPYAEQQRRADLQDGCNNHNRDAPEKKPIGSQQQVNKTIIKLSEQGTSINNTFVSSTQPVANGSRIASEYGIPRSVNTVGSHEALPIPPPMVPMNSSGSSYVTREERETRTVTVEVHRQQADEAKRQQQQQKQFQQLQQQRVEFNSHYSHNTLQPTHSLPSHTTPTKHPEFHKCLRNNSTQLQQQPQQQTTLFQQSQQQQSIQNYRNTRQADSSSLSSAITEELKKRKEKQRLNAATANNNASNNNNINAHNQGNYININGKQNHYSQCRLPPQQQQQQQQLHHHNTLHQPLALKAQQQQQPHYHTTPLSPSSSSLSLSAPPTSPTTSSAPAPAPLSASTATTVALSARAASNNVNGSERNNHSHNSSHNNSSSQNIPTVGTSAIAGVGVGVGAGDQHSALMDEFKRAHQRMFKNGFQETERKERQEALRKTTMMEDDVNHRASRMLRNDNGPIANGTQFQIPPPPPQFASSPPRNQPVQYNTNNNNNKYTAQQQPLPQKTSNSYNNGVTTLKAPTEQPPKPPATPVPDYDNVEIRTKATTISSSVRPSYGYASTNIVTNGRDASNDNSNNNNNNNNNRRTLRAGSITIGEYEQPQQRREPAKFDFVGTPRRSNGTALEATADQLQTELQHTLTRSKLKKSAELLEHQSNCPLRSSYENYENVARKLHGVSINEVASTAPPPMRLSNGTGNGGTNGILKNGNRHSGSGGGGTRNSDKTITFGN